ncbi:hypothetical protein Y88_0425 [Novosphingobium nitrogenifigens DSM 19370]|uniref:Uncharacterized protein n=1 Tax=Novosphingobium nitrogenifigens DSM 19370 TaxID=983920 RepID=F1ZAJ2_9SPHN|nr:hypothetical protein Y88_0425 [Novosphingobium nitrogenifigens DSM 19370]
MKPGSLRILNDRFPREPTFPQPLLNGMSWSAAANSGTRRRGTKRLFVEDPINDRRCR